jgi:pilus assembly protein CpaB
VAQNLAPRLRDRITALVPGAGWRRALLLRRLAAGVLAVLALVLAVAPTESRGVPGVVAARDLVAGSTVTEADLDVRRWPDDLVPAGALRDPAAARDRVLVGAARAGEPLTDARLAGAGPLSSAGPNTAAVPVRLADPGVAGLLTPGSRVDVVAVADADGAPVVLAPNAVVLAVLPAAGGPVGPAPGRLILIGTARELATRVAAASVADQLAVTLR